MILQQISGARRFSSNLIVGGLAMLLFDNISFRPIFTGIIQEIPNLAPNFDKLIFGTGTTAAQSFYTVAFVAMSWLIGEVLIRSAEFQDFAYIGGKRTAIRCLTQSDAQWTRMQKLFTKPLFEVPVRKNLIADVTDAVKKNGFSPLSSNEWDDTDLRQCFDVASFVTEKSARISGSLRGWGDAANVIFAIGMVLVLAGFVEICAVPALTFVEGKIPSAVGNFIAGLFMVRLGTWSLRFSSYLQVRQVDQLLMYFVFKANKPKRGRSEKGRDDETGSKS